MSMNRAFISSCLFAFAITSQATVAQESPTVPPTPYMAPYISCGAGCIEFGLLLDMEREMNQTSRPPASPQSGQATTSGSGVNNAVVTDRRDADIGR